MQDGTFIKIIFWIFLSIAFFIILTLPTNSENEKPVGNSHICDSLKCEIKNQSMTNNNWGWTNNYCLTKGYTKDGVLITIPRCKF